MMRFIASVFLLASTCHSAELLGYLENWVDVNWWDNNIPGNCLMGCFKPNAYIEAIRPYSSLNYGFTFLTTNPNPDQTGCSGLEGGNVSAAGPCPIWDGNAIYLAAAGKQGSHAIDQSTTAATPGIVAVAEAARMAHMHPDGPKRFKICLGGWSDYARLENSANGKSVAKLMAQLVLWTFSDGVDLDFEHLTPFDAMGDEFEAFSALISALRAELDAVSQQWVSFAKERQATLQAEYDALPNWQKTNMVRYYNTTIKYLDEVIANGPNHLEISWTTRFNAFIPSSDPWNYLKPSSPVPSTNFETDNEGLKVYPPVGDSIDVVNIMAYDGGTDAGPLQLNFETILENFAGLGKVPKEKINMGFEPGEQAAGGVWEGMDADIATAQYVLDQGYGGAMIWAVNPSPTTNPQGTQLCPELASRLSTLMAPSWRFGREPTYTHCDASTGWWPGL